MGIAWVDDQEGKKTDWSPQKNKGGEDKGNKVTRMLAGGGRGVGKSGKKGVQNPSSSPREVG